MSNVLVNKDKLDVLANAIANKSGESLTLTLDEMVDAVDGIDTSGGTPTLETVTKTYTPSTSAVTDTITPSSGYDGIEEVDVTVSAIPTATIGDWSYSSEYYTQNNQRKWKSRYSEEVSSDGYFGLYEAGDVRFADGYTTRNAIAKNTSVTPTESSQSIGGDDYMMEGAVTVNAIPSNYVGSGITQRTSSDLSASGATVTAPSGYYASSASKTISSGSATASATKGTVSNHSVTVTPSVTRTAGYVTAGSSNGTAVTVSASELVSGSQTVTENDTYDVTNLATLVVNVSGGGGSTVAVGTKTTTLSASASSISFTSLSGNPTSFVVTSSADQSTGGTKAVAVAYDGTNLFGMDVTTQAENDTGFTKSYSSGTLTITATSATFEANEYKLVYTYGGSSSDIHTADVQVGSGATSITFSSLSGRPLYFSCVFKSTFSTSSGYQRVIDVVNDGTNTYGHAFDSSAKAQTSWTYSYSGGSLTITSQGTNNGGYFHQPGYYQLTYAVDDSAPSYQTKSVYATTSAQTITADNGYDALEQVNLGALSQTNLTAGNIKSGTTVTINNGNTNVWSVLGTYTGGGSTDHLTKIATKSLGTISTSSTSATDTGQTLDVSGFDAYDMLIAICHTTTHTNGRHVATVRLINFSATSSTATKTGTSIATSTQHYKLSSSGTLTQRSGTTAYGVYVNAATINTTTPRTLTLTIYQRYNSTSTGTINGSYTLDVYGVKLQDLF